MSLDYETGKILEQILQKLQDIELETQQTNHYLEQLFNTETPTQPETPTEKEVVYDEQNRPLIIPPNKKITRTPTTNKTKKQEEYTQEEI